MKTNSSVARKNNPLSASLQTLLVFISLFCFAPCPVAQQAATEPLSSTGDSAVDPSSVPPDSMTQSAASGSEATGTSAASGISGPGASSAVGNNLDFQADLFTGRFSYGIPIVAAPARQGTQPKIVLGYSSSGGNGWCGMGWSLDMGFIQRQTRYGVPIKWSGALPLTQYENTNGFSFSLGGVSSLLVNVGGNEYRAEGEGGFLKFLFYENYWEATDKGGTKFYFGESASSRMENSKPGWTPGVTASTFRWALNRIRDINGNETYLTYTTDSGQLYLSQISYNANVNTPAIPATHTVDFLLENRSDTNITLEAGFRVETRKRLSQITAKANGNPVRRYVLGYNYSASTSRSLLSSVTEYGSDDVSALPPLTFSYQGKPFEFEAQSIWPGVSSQGQTDPAWNGIQTSDQSGEVYVGLIDVDRDGLPDRVMRNFASPYNQYVIQRNTGSGFTGNYAWTPLSSQGQTSTEWNSIRGQTKFSLRDGGNIPGTTHLEFVDLNGDGLPDRIMRNAATPSNPWQVQLTTGILGAGAFGSESPWGSILSESNAVEWYSIQSQNIYGIPERRAGGGDPGEPAYYESLETIVDLLDINGDGLLDRVLRKLSGTQDRYKVQLNSRTGFGTILDWAGIQGNGAVSWSDYPDDGNPNGGNINGTGANVTVLLRDINGDGLPDRILTNTTAGFTVQFNNGAGFEPTETWGPLDPLSTIYPTAVDTHSDTTCVLADINGDGLPDRIMRAPSSPYTNFVVQLNNGHG
ncbi:MAG: hypothetical protein DMG13_33870, partial [Acidobacteria bacterium]